MKYETARYILPKVYSNADHKIGKKMLRIWFKVLMPGQRLIHLEEQLHCFIIFIPFESSLCKHIALSGEKWSVIIAVSGSSFQFDTHSAYIRICFADSCWEKKTCVLVVVLCKIKKRKPVFL
jgi:hypothetical protein